MKSMNVLFAAAECVPFMKTGGLADVAGSLPEALNEKGADVRVIMPLYASVKDVYRAQMKELGFIYVSVGWRHVYCGIKELVHEGVVYYFIDNEHYFRRGSAYGYGDDGERYAFFCRAVLDALPVMGFIPDVLHCHDWHTGMIPALLKHHYWHRPEYSHMKTVFTIHNLQYQGNYPHQALGDWLGLQNEMFTPDGVEYHGSVSFMKAGIQLADRVTTVSPTYANEIRTAEYGYGMDGTLRAKGERLLGVVNGIDARSYNPETDLFIPFPYKDSLKLKKQNKTALQQELGLPVNDAIPLIGMVGRLVDQKGLPLVLEVLDELLQTEDIQLVLLGTGEPEMEHAFRAAQYRYPGKMVSWIGFDDGVARRIYAASDMFLMPSLFEPCGISQLLALRYGSLPIVREVGGLKDTVQSYNEWTGEGNGFSFANYNSRDMLNTIRYAIHIWWNESHRSKLTAAAFAGDYSWGASAEQYIALYKELSQ